MESDVEGGVASASGGREGFRGAVMVVADGWFVGAKMGEMCDGFHREVARCVVLHVLLARDDHR